MKLNVEKLINYIPEPVTALLAYLGAFVVVVIASLLYLKLLQEIQVC